MTAAMKRTLTNRKPVPDTYLALIQEFPLRRIKSTTDHARATRLVLRLSSDPLDQGTADYLDVLVGLIADYETRAQYNFDTTRVSAAELVRHRMEERGLSISAIARLTGVPQSNLSDMLHGKRSWSKNAIRTLSSHLNIRADRFLT